ncbi:MAG: hypothetical protein ACK5MW_05755 [Enterococcus sp.]
MKKIITTSVLSLGLLLSLSACTDVTDDEARIPDTFAFITTSTTLQELEDGLGRPDDIFTKKQAKTDIDSYQEILTQGKESLTSAEETADSSDSLSSTDLDNALSASKVAEKDENLMEYKYDYKKNGQSYQYTIFVNKEEILFLPDIDKYTE